MSATNLLTTAARRRKRRGMPQTFYGLLLGRSHAGGHWRTVWHCEHEHDDTRSAEQCAGVERRAREIEGNL